MPTHPMVAAILSTAFLLAGCASDPPSASAPAPGTGSTASSSTPWHLTFNATLGYNAAYGEPFTQLTSGGGECTYLSFPVPANATHLAARMTGEAVASGSTGAGYLTFQLVAADGHSLVAPNDTSQSLDIKVTVDNPAPGSWNAWAWPNGAVARQFWPIQVTVEGTGPPPQKGKATTTDTAGEAC